MTNPTPDLTGSDAKYATVGDLYVVFKASQQIDFGAPVYLNSISITIVDTANTPMVKDTDWIAGPSDDTAFSRALVLSPAFTDILVSSITISSSRAVPYQISCSYQRFYPDAIADLQARMTVVETKLAALATIAATTPATPKLLDPDINESNSANVVTAEPYAVNTFSGQNMIVPASGAFFADSVTLTLPTIPVTTLVKDVDYVIVMCDRDRTRQTSNQSGVYRAILLTRPYAGTVQVTYHAFGGEVTLADVTAINETVANISAYLAGNEFLTPGSIGANTVIVAMISRLSALESALTNSANVGTANFNGYMTNWLDGLPTTNPGTSGTWWNDGGIPTLTA